MFVISSFLRLDTVTAGQRRSARALLQYEYQIAELRATSRNIYIIERIPVYEY